MNIILIAWLVLTTTSSLLVLSACIIAGRADDILTTLPPRAFRPSSGAAGGRLGGVRVQPSTATPWLMQAAAPTCQPTQLHRKLRHIPYNIQK